MSILVDNDITPPMQFEVVNKDYVVCVISNMEKCGRTGFNGCNVNGP